MATDTNIDHLIITASMLHVLYRDSLLCTYVTAVLRVSPLLLGHVLHDYSQYAVHIQDLARSSCYCM